MPKKMLLIPFKRLKITNEMNIGACLMCLGCFMIGVGVGENIIDFTADLFGGKGKVPKMPNPPPKPEKKKSSEDLDGMIKALKYLK